MLLTGNYRVSVEMQGFKTSVRDKVYLPIRTRLQVDVQLELGTVNESVSVTAEAPLLETDSVSSGRVLSNRELADLPMPINNPIYLTNLSTGVQTTGGTTQITNVANFIIKYQLLRAYPQVNGLTNNRVPLGKARSHSLELSMQRRFSSGFMVNAGYTALYLREKDFFMNEFDTVPTERESSDGRPHRFFANGVLQMPFGKGRALLQTGVLSRLFGGWQLAATYEYQPGALLSFGNLFYYGKISDINTGERTLSRWFNTDNFERVSTKAPGSYHKRVFPTFVPGLRASSQNRWNANLQREFPLKEGVKLQFRTDVLNVFNRSGWSAPNTSPLSSNFGMVTSTQQSDKRWIQLQARVRF